MSRKAGPAIQHVHAIIHLTLTHKEKGPRHWHDPFKMLLLAGLALTGFEPALRLVDHIDAALTAHDAAIAVALLERTEGVTYLHGSFPVCRGARIAPWVSFHPGRGPER